MSKENDFNFNTATFYFGPGHRCAPKNYDSERVRELASTLYMEEIDTSMSHLSENVMETAKRLAENAKIENVSVQKGEGSTLDIFDNGVKIYNVGMDVSIPLECYQQIMPDGNYAARLVTDPGYTWEDYDRLEKLAQEQDAEFLNAVDAIDTVEAGIEQ